MLFMYLGCVVLFMYFELCSAVYVLWLCSLFMYCELRSLVYVQ